MKYTAPASKDDVRQRYRIFAGLVLAILVVLGLRLGQIQLLDMERDAGEAAGNAIRPNLVRPARVYMFDRNGTLLVDNQTVLSVTVAPRVFDRSNLPLVAELAGVPLDALTERFDEILARSRYQTDMLIRD